MLPIYIDISDYNVLVLGGGYEATKKTSRLIKYGPHIQIYSLDFSEELKRLALSGRVKLIEGDVRDYKRLEALIKDSDLIIYTVPGLDDVEAWVCSICRKYKKIHIISTNAKITQAALPVEMELHDLHITVFSGGKSTLVSMKTLDLIRECLVDKDYLGILLEAMYFLKIYMKERGVSYKTRMRLYREMFNDINLIRYVMKGDLKGAKQYIKKRVDDVAREK